MLLIEVDATLVGCRYRRKSAVATARGTITGVASAGSDRMQPQNAREQKSPARSAASPADQIRASAAEHLSPTKARAVDALTTIQQMHLTEFHNER